MAVTTGAFHWIESYSVNVALLDEQHRGLITTVNELVSALGNGEGTAVTDGVLQKLVDYALTHFAAEESLMSEHNFPGLAKHKIEHQNFTAKVAKFIEEYRSGKAGVPVSLAFFLQTWLKQHIQTTDKAYSAFLNARGVH